jgi:hypothetical protein
VRAAEVELESELVQARLADMEAELCAEHVSLQKSSSEVAGLKQEIERRNGLDQQIRQVRGRN